MSRLHLITFDHNGRLAVEKEMGNLHLFYTVIWEELQDKYLDKELRKDYLRRDEFMKQTWALWQDERLEYWERVVLASTYDYAIVKREQIPVLIECMKEWTRWYQGGRLPMIWGELEEIKDEPAIFGIGFEHSISDQWHQWAEKPTGKKDKWGDDEVEYVWDFSDPKTFYPLDLLAKPVPTNGGKEEQMEPSELIESLIRNGATLEGNSGAKLFYDDVKILYGGGFVVERYQSRPRGFAKHYDGDDFAEALRVFAEQEKEE